MIIVAGQATELTMDAQNGSQFTGGF